MPLDIWEAARTGNLEGVQDILATNSGGADNRDKEGNTPLRYAAYEGHLEIVKYLVAKKADVNAKDQFGFAPLHLAGERNHLDIVKLLLDNGADVNLRGGGADYTPLHLVVLMGHFELVQLLVNHGADVNAIAVHGTTPLHIACKEGRTEIAHYLLQKGANINAKDGDDATPLHWAYFAKGYHKISDELIELLIARGVKKKVKDSIGQTPPEYEKNGQMKRKISIEGIE